MFTCHIKSTSVVQALQLAKDNLKKACAETDRINKVMQNKTECFIGQTNQVIEFGFGYTTRLSDKWTGETGLTYLLKFIEDEGLSLKDCYIDVGYGEASLCVQGDSALPYLTARNKKFSDEYLAQRQLDLKTREAAETLQKEALKVVQDLIADECEELNKQFASFDWPAVATKCFSGKYDILIKYQTEVEYPHPIYHNVFKIHFQSIKGIDPRTFKNRKQI